MIEINLSEYLNSAFIDTVDPLNIHLWNRCWPLDLEDSCGDIAGYIPYHVVAINGIVAYLYNHHISL